MVEFVYRPKRMVSGKRVISPYFSGRYSIRRGAPIVTVALETTDRRVAEKRLRDIVAAKQREAEGIVAPASVRDAAASPLTQLLADYRVDLVGLGRSGAHVKETTGRIARVIRAAGWVHLQDVKAESFIKWRASCDRSAKTKKEYQTSVNAFLNWLVKMDRLAVNPLAKIDPVDVRGRAVRKSRAFSMDEVVSLCRVTPDYRRAVYLFLTYTGARKKEARLLRWSDVRLGERPEVLIRAENAKDRDKRPIPLRAELAEILRGMHRGLGGAVEDLVFFGVSLG
ncbi:MAG: site-specific integrase [Nibricoccus sp.]